MRTHAVHFFQHDREVGAFDQARAVLLGQQSMCSLTEGQYLIQQLLCKRERRILAARSQASRARAFLHPFVRAPLQFVRQGPAVQCVLLLHQYLKLGYEQRRPGLREVVLYELLQQPQVRNIRLRG